MIKICLLYTIKEREAYLLPVHFLIECWPWELVSIPYSKHKHDLLLGVVFAAFLVYKLQFVSIRSIPSST